MGQEKENPGMAGALLGVLEHQHEVAILWRSYSRAGVLTGLLPDHRLTGSAARAPLRQADVTAEQITLHQRDQVGTIKLVLVVWNPDETLNVRQRDQLNIPGMVKGLARSLTACCRIR